MGSLPIADSLEAVLHFLREPKCAIVMNTDLTVCLKKDCWLGLKASAGPDI